MYIINNITTNPLYFKNAEIVESWIRGFVDFPRYGLESTCPQRGAMLEILTV